MKTKENEPPKSGYQPRPVAPPSVGRALSVLVAAGAVLWVWLFLPEWLQTDAENQLNSARELRTILYSAPVMLLLVVGANAVVFNGATRLMWQGSRPTFRQDANRAGVLILCLLFHLFTPICGFLLPLAIALAAD